MLGFGFTVSLIFFSLSSAHFPRLPTQNRPLSRKPVPYRGSAKKKQKGFSAVCAPGHSLPTSG